MISVEQLIYNSYVVKFNSNYSIIYDRKNPTKLLLHAICDHKNGLYYIPFIDRTILNFDTKDHFSTWLYHFFYYSFSYFSDHKINQSHQFLAQGAELCELLNDFT